MSVRSILAEAGQALRFNRQRSILTCVSLAWGVACFVILYSYGDGFQVALQTAFRAVGQDLVPMVGAISPEMMLRGMTVVRGYRTQTMTVRAAYSIYNRIRNESMFSGRWL